MMSELYFKTFVFSYGSIHLEDPPLFEAYIRPPIVTLEHTIEVIPFPESFAFSPLSVFPI